MKFLPSTWYFYNLGLLVNYSLQESVVSLTLVKWDGSVVVCTRESEGEAGELFHLVLGGYGLFGVMVEVEVKVVVGTGAKHL